MKDITWKDFLRKCDADGENTMPWDYRKDQIIADEEAMKMWLAGASSSLSQPTEIPRIEVRAWATSQIEDEGDNDV